MKKFEGRFKNAKWIWYENPFFDLINVWMDARLEFFVKKKPENVIVYVSADARYRLYVNGIFVNYGPARGFQLSPYLKKGKNVIAARVHQLGVGTSQYIHQGTAGFILSGKVGDVDISTGKKWRVRKSSAYKKNVKRVSREQGFQEHFDARIDDETWLFPDYNDSNWETQGNSKSGFLETDDVVQLFLDEKHEWKKTNIKLKRENCWYSFIINPSSAKKYTAYLIDFGHEVVGSIRLSLENTSGGEIVDTLVCETISGLEPDILPPEILSSRQAFGNRLICRKGVTDHEMFDYWGFRYLIVVFRNFYRPVKVKITLNHTGYPLNIV